MNILSCTCEIIVVVCSEYGLCGRANVCFWFSQFIFFFLVVHCCAVVHLSRVVCSLDTLMCSPFAFVTLSLSLKFVRRFRYAIFFFVFFCSISAVGRLRTRYTRLIFITLRFACAHPSACLFLPNSYRSVFQCSFSPTALASLSRYLLSSTVAIFPWQNIPKIPTKAHHRNRLCIVFCDSFAAFFLSLSLFNFSFDNRKRSFLNVPGFRLLSTERSVWSGHFKSIF